MLGLTVESFGTSTPELLVSLDAALRGAGGIAIGSNIFNILAILGITALVSPIPVAPRSP